MKRAHEEIRKKKEARAEENSRRAAEKARKEQRKAAQSRLAGDNPTQKLDDMCRRFGIPDPSPEDGSIEEVLSRLEAKFGSMRFTSKPKTKGCGHGRWWPRVYGLSACDFCDKEFPMYTLRCPQCDARACVPCKIREAGC
jgi:hypothetical protein